MNRRTNAERIVQCALETFCEKGFKGASIRAIAARSGVSVGNVYNHAISKEALFDRLFEEHFPGAHLERILRDVKPGADLDGTMEGIVANMLRYADEDPYFFRLVLVDLNEFGGAHLRRFGAPYDRPLGEIVAGLPEGEGFSSAMGSLRKDVGGGEFTRFFLWLFYAMGFTAAMRKAMTLDEEDDGTFRTVLKVLQRGVAEKISDDTKDSKERTRT
jgi:AcrR family transcriptional regulator